MVDKLAVSAIRQESVFLDSTSCVASSSIRKQQCVLLVEYKQGEMNVFIKKSISGMKKC
jgi:hypothetical protein